MKRLGNFGMTSIGSFVVLAAVAAWSSMARADDEPREKPRERPAAAGEREAQVAKIRERLGQLEREVKELREAGKSDAAEAKLKELQALRGHLAELKSGEARETRPDQPRPDQPRPDQPRPDQPRPEIPAEVREKLENMRREIAKLREAGENEKAAQLERQGHEIMARFGVGQSPDSPQARQQHLRMAVQNLRMAAEHLRAGGMVEMADRLSDQVRRMEQELGGDRPGPREGDQPRREGDQPRREGERREADQPRREGDQPRREADQPRREGDQPRREGDEPRKERD